MGGRGRGSYGLGMSPNNSLKIACWDAVAVASKRNAVVMSDVAAVGFCRAT